MQVPHTLAWRKYVGPFFIVAAIAGSFANRDDHERAWDQMNTARERNEQRRH